MATNPLGIFSAALGAGPHTEPMDVGQMLRTAALQGAQTQGLQAETQEAQARTQGIGIQNQKAQIDLQLEQQRRAAAQEYAKQVPSSPPPASFPGAPANPNDPNYHAAMASASNPVPTFDWNGYAVKLLSMGDLEGGITALKTHQEFQKNSLDNAKKSLDNLDTQNTSRGKYAASVMKLLQEKGPEAAAALWQTVGPQMESEGLLKPGQGSAPFDPQKVDALYKQAVGADDPIQHAKNALEDQAAGIAEKKAQTAHATAAAAELGEQTKQLQLSNQAAEEFVKNPGAILGAGGMVERLGLDPATTSRLKNQIYAVWQMPGTPKEKQQAVNSAIQKATDQANELAKQTNPALLAFDVKKAGMVAEAQNNAFSLTPDAVQMAAQQYRQTGQMPSIARNRAAQKQIMDAAAAMGPIDLASNAAAFKANEASLVGLQKNLDSVTAFENTARKNLDLFLSQAKKVIDTGSPLVNGPARAAARALGGSADQAAYETARQVAINEVAKVTGNPGLSGQLSDSARHEVEAFNPNSATLAQTVAVIKTLKTDMENRRGSYQDQIGDIKKRIGGGNPGAPAAPSSGTIRVKRKSDGAAGTINASDFDPGKYDRL